LVLGFGEDLSEERQRGAEFFEVQNCLWIYEKEKERNARGFNKKSSLNETQNFVEPYG
jgi:hypothetical protein